MSTYTRSGRRRRAARTALGLGLVACAAAATGPTAAHAAEPGEASRSGSRVTYTSASTTPHQVATSLDSAGQLVVSDSAGVRGVGGCLTSSSTEVRCGTGVAEVTVRLTQGDAVLTPAAAVATRVLGSPRDDTVRGGQAPAVSAVLFQGGAGVDTVDYSRADRFVRVTLDGRADDGRQDDRDNAAPDVERVIGSPFPDQLVGSVGTNFFTGGSGADRMSGGDGTDRFDEGVRTSGADDIAGGAGGFDLVDYSARSTGIRVTMDGIADDGAVGEGDNVRATTEQVVSGSGPDVLVGGAAENLLVTGAGDDQVTAGGGGDIIDAGQGEDVVRAGPGDDRVFVRDGERDEVFCGTGRDLVQFDEGLDVVVGCEVLDAA